MKNGLLSVLLIGGGAREHSMAKKFSESPFIDHDRKFAIPGNGGIQSDGWQSADISIRDIRGLAVFAEENSIDFTFIGPEEPLVNGIVSQWRKPIWGPNLQGAMLEADKLVAKELMDKLNVSTARPWLSFTGNAMAHLWAESQPENIGWAIKYRFLARGQGVLITHNRHETHEAIDEMVCRYGQDAKFIIEPLLPGHEKSREVSLICHRVMAEYFILPPTHDYKRYGEGDTRRNTGGMGCYAPVPWFTLEMQERAMDQILRPIFSSTRFQGTFYAGLMVDDQGKSSVVEFNCRGGDPETQTQNALIEGDLLEYMYTRLTTRFPGAPKLKIKDKKAVTVVLCLKGYPEKPKTGALISGLEETAKINEVQIIHAGTQLIDGKFYVSARRVINVVGVGDTFSQAADRAYSAVEMIHFDDIYYRTDIASSVC